MNKFTAAFVTIPFAIACASSPTSSNTEDAVSKATAQAALEIGDEAIQSEPSPIAADAGAGADDAGAPTHDCSEGREQCVCTELVCRETCRDGRWAALTNPAGYVCVDDGAEYVCNHPGQRICRPGKTLICAEDRTMREYVRPDQNIDCTYPDVDVMSLPRWLPEPS